MSTPPSEDMLVQRQLRAAEIALETARRRRFENDEAMRELREAATRAESALIENRVDRAREAEQHRVEMAALRAQLADAEQRHQMERNRRLALDQQLTAARREADALNGATRQLAAEQRIRQLEAELEVVLRHAAEFEQGVRVAAIDAFKLVRDVAERVQARFPQPESPEPASLERDDIARGPEPVQPEPASSWRGARAARRAEPAVQPPEPGFAWVESAAQRVEAAAQRVEAAAQEPAPALGWEADAQAAGELDSAPPIDASGGPEAELSVRPEDTPVRWTEAPVLWQQAPRRPHEFGAAQRVDPPPPAVPPAAPRSPLFPPRQPDTIKPPPVASVLDSELDSHRLDAALHRLRMMSPPTDAPD